MENFDIELQVSLFCDGLSKNECRELLYILENDGKDALVENLYTIIYDDKE